MLRRPKPTDSEADLLREQEQFLASGKPSTVHVVRRPDKRRGDLGSGDSENAPGSQRDVVTIPDLPDQIPSLTPAPPKKSRFKKERVRFEDDDAEERLDRHDTHISAVLSRIIERDTSTVPVSLPAFTGLAFPKVLHRSTVENQGQSTVPGGRKSIFARQIEAHRAKEGSAPLQTTTHAHVAPSAVSKSATSSSSVTSMETGHPQAAFAGASGGPLLVSGRGLGRADGTAEVLKIHQENQARLQEMSESEILEEQRKLLAQLDPRLVNFVKSRKTQKPQNVTSASSPARDEDVGNLGPADNAAAQPDNTEPEHVLADVVIDNDLSDSEATETQPPITAKELPIKVEKDWLHMDRLEPEKLEWMRDLPAPRRRGTKKAMQARFDFAGTLIPPTQDLPTHLGLHHHGDEPELAGYSLQELFPLSRSQVTQQRTLALNTLANILSKARAGEYAASLKGSMLVTLLDAGLIFLLRFSLDDSVEGVMSAAVRALRVLLVSSKDEECLDDTFSWHLGMAAFPLLPTAEEEEDDEEEAGLGEIVKEKEERKADHDVVRQDVVKGLLKMKVLPRLRYILEVVRPSPQVVLEILEVLIRFARHSSSAATQILDCPRLMETVMSEFLPCSWTPVSSSTPPTSLYGQPVSMAMKLLRVLATSGRHACARLLNSLGGRERLSRFLAAEPSELLLEPGESLRCSTEALRFWAVATSYGQACNLYRDLYPVLMRGLQSAHKPSAPSTQLLSVELQRIRALLMLLTQVTHTAGCHQELQASLASSQDAESLPPPPVTWGHVTGLQPTLIGLLKGCLKTLDDPVQRACALSLLPSYLLYVGAFYSQLSIQNSFQPVECLQELESLTSEVLLPLLSHQALCSVIDSLRSCSVICNPMSCGSGPEIVSSLPGLGCSPLKTHADRTGTSSPLPLLTAFYYLLDVIAGIHRGLAKKFSSLVLRDSVLCYLQACGETRPTVSLSTAWILRHEHHLLYLQLRLAHRLVPVDAEVAKHAALIHKVTLGLVMWLLPGSEYLAHCLMSSSVFNQELLPEAGSGGPEAAELSELRLQEAPAPAPGLGVLLRDAVSQLPSLRGCFLRHLSHLEPAVLTSRDRHCGRAPWVKSQLLPELSGPSLPSDWPFLPLISLYERMGVLSGGGLEVEALPPGSVQSVIQCLQWLLVLETWREQSLKVVPPVAKLARLFCVFLSSSDLFLDKPVQQLMWAHLRGLTRPKQLAALDLGTPPPGLASFQDLYSALLAQFEAVSFGDVVFGCFLILPLQRRYSATLRMAVFGEHVGLLRSLGVPLQQLPIPLENFTSPPEDSLPLLRLYFRALVTGALRRSWCPVLYAVAVAHLNSFIFSQDAVAQEVDAARRSMLRKTHYLTDEVLRNHLLFFRLPEQNSELGFLTYEQLPSIRSRRLESVLGTVEGKVAMED
ncbi:RNA polymerase II-associated protein 1 [Chanos chanos]|uniref:RNA polymerase II-associated protein 1 n=1 Tax=Chanos chanos TaxID=29144 RepID=A0A6J2W891_CHACN|nr:RNA polymerase II-associated protein 1 [Chanos chanos]